MNETTKQANSVANDAPTNLESSNDSDSMQFQVPDDLQGERIDKVLATLLPQYSRSMLQKWLKQSLITVDDEIISQKQKMIGGEEITIIPPTIDENELALVAEDIAIDIIYEDEDVMVINKPAGLVVHPGAGNRSGTLMNALLFHNEQLFNLPRAGIVHRLDKDTSGLMVVAKNDKARLSLVEQLQDRTVSRTYNALVNNVPVAGGTVDMQIARHKTDRIKMAVYNNFGKEAITHFRVSHKYQRHALLEVNLETGRTHQIRVHMQHKNYPLIGDPLYGQRLRLYTDMSDELRDQLTNFPRQALHALRLKFIHPATDELVEFECPLPEDMLHLMDLLSEHQADYNKY